MPEFRLIIFDDNREFRVSLVKLFESVDDVIVIQHYPDCTHLYTRVTESNPDVVLMDIDMPGVNGIEATAEIKRLFPAIQVVMLTVSEEENRIFEALRNGAMGYLLKKSDPEEIIEAVRTVAKGGSPMTPAIARKVLQYFHAQDNAFSEISKENVVDQEKIAAQSGEAIGTLLTPREQEILESLVDGLSYKLIASKFFISTDTVKNHIQGIYRKLHVNSKGEAINFALKNKLTTLK